MVGRRFWVLLFALFWMLLPASASAQTALSITASSLDTQDYPVLRLNLDARGPGGVFISDLDASQVRIVENGQALPVDSLELQQPGAQYVFAFNPALTFAIRDTQGRTRYDYLADTLRTWAQTTAGGDDLSFLFNNGPQQVHLSDPAAWQALLDSAPTDQRSALPNWQILSQAITTAADPTPRPGMGRGVLFITTNPESSTIAVLQNVTALAQQNGVSVSVWMISGEAFFASQGAEALRNLAAATGGEFFGYSGVETIPDPEQYIAPLRSAYRLAYTSRIAGAGPHTLAVELTRPEGQASSSPLEFDLDIQPPAPVFVFPPTELTITLPDPDATDVAVDYSPPIVQQLEILVDFPDGYNRALTRTSLYVDGQLVDENTTAPFEFFDWDISQYTESGRHIVQAEAVDIIGLSRVSIETPIDVVVLTPGGLPPEIGGRSTSTLVAIAVVLVAGATLIISLVLAVRGRASAAARPPRVRRQRPDPVYQSIAEIEENTTGKLRLTNWASQLQNRLPWPQRSQRTDQPYAYLERLPALGDLESLTPSKPLAIHTPEVTLGANPQQATLVLEDPSVEPLHARLYMQENGLFYLQDQGSVAGTWVNYQSILPGGMGVRLNSGDVLHIGRAGFRFIMPTTQPLRPPSVIRDKQAL